MEEGSSFQRREEVEIAIVGGGLGGLALALALQERGITAHLYEKHHDLRSDTATAIGIGANGVKSLNGIRSGLSKVMEDAGTYASCLKLTLVNKKGEVRYREQTFEQGEYVSIGWKQAQLVLASYINKDLIHCSHRLVRFESSEAGVDAYFEVTDENTSSLEYIKVVRTKLLVGADGIWSVVRRTIVGDSPRYLHLVDWNAYVPNPGAKVFGGHGEHEIVLLFDEDGETRSWLVDAGKGFSLWILRKLDLSGDLAKTLKRSKGGLGIPGAKARALQQLDGLDGWDDIKAAIKATDETYIFERPIMDNLPIKRWSDSHRRVLLMGDAAHAQYVGPGQGARTAFEDAHQLSILLKEAFSSSEDNSIATAVKKFEELRIPRMIKMQEYAAESTALPALVPEWVSKLTMEEKQKRALECQQWVHSYPEKMLCDPDSTYWK
ncbi:hypothetical protein O6H91_16G033200 [Diphasiastrum complanatum]|uniref:Uncharacterized protein n=3 Tax=Diphasiastrum complanatum TaxID=34168 RepID=A0ACC2BBB3_DIPCM|nr:hypothetical protein O6H91_16G033200 [Diphasiastrum complanatum]KAJ7527033.1 hypothetical protein O6H91_16G033200 [Diphasiastrum complanatum]